MKGTRTKVRIAAIKQRIERDCKVCFEKFTRRFQTRNRICFVFVTNCYKIVLWVFTVVDMANVFMTGQIKNICFELCSSEFE